MSQYRNLYIHIPFCRTKCDYCAFYSEIGMEAFFSAYLERLTQALKSAPLADSLDTLYIGGGTPTLPDIYWLEKLVKILPPAQESSIESNPETLDKNKVELLADSFSRISTGVQAFSSHYRQILGRDSSSKSIHNALELIANAPFKHRNIDLIYAIGNQSTKDWEQELKTALEYPIDHLSCYALTMEENNRLQPNAQLADHDDRESDMAAVTKDILAPRLQQYEVSNYAKIGAECQHNLNVWSGKTYLGLGSAAASFDGVNRQINSASITDFLNSEVAEVDILPAQERANEVFVMNLRTVAGWSRELWNSNGLKNRPEWETMQNRVLSLAQLYPELWDISSEHVRLSSYGLDFWDSMAAELL